MRGTPRRRRLGKPAEIAVGVENAGRDPVRFCRWDNSVPRLACRVHGIQIIMVSLFFTRKEGSRASYTFTHNTVTSGRALCLWLSLSELCVRCE